MKRIDSLDVLRGVAILGTLGTNIWLFTDPNGPYASQVGTFDSGGLVEPFLHFLANGKFLGLLSVIFGVGLELQYRSARRRGARWPGRYLWRAALLFTEGLLHFLLVFEFDILMGYAVVSVVVAYLVKLSDRAVVRWIAAMAALHVLMVAFGTLRLIGTDPRADFDGRTTLFTDGSWADQVQARVHDWVAYRTESIFIVPMCVALFLVGVQLLRAGAFEATPASARLRRALMIAGLGVAAPLNLATTYAGPTWFLVNRYLLPPVVALGLFGLVTTLVRLPAARGGPGPMRRGLSAVGRTSLSCYVFQNLVAAALCYGWGLGLAATLAGLRPWWTVAAWAGICALFMPLAVLWLRRFDRGPLEMLWRRAYQPSPASLEPAGR